MAKIILFDSIERRKNPSQRFNEPLANLQRVTCSNQCLLVELSSLAVHLSFPQPPNRQ